MTTAPLPVVRRRAGNRRRCVLALAVTFAMLAAACQRPDRHATLGVSRVALNLAFSEEGLVEPVEPEVIVRLVPTPPEVQEPEDVLKFASPTEAPPPPPQSSPPRSIPQPRSLCPEVVAGDAPARSIDFQVKRPPDQGVYVRVNTGKIVVTGGVIPITLPYPPLSTWQVIHLPDLVSPGVSGVTADTLRRTWKTRRIIAPGFEITDQVRIDGNNLQLVVRETMVNGVTTTFRPSPPINFYVAGTEGDTWTSAGVDSASGTAMVVQGVIKQREVVNACGTPVDSYRVTLDEQVVNLGTGETTGTETGEPNIYNVATQFGGLIVREDVHTTTATRTESGVPVTIEFDYVSTVRGLMPTDLPK